MSISLGMLAHDLIDAKTPVAVFFFLPDGPEDAHWLSTSERATIASVLAAEREQSGEQLHGLWGALADPRVVLLCAVYFAIVVGL